MAVTFPSSPVNGQTYSANGQQYTYNAEAGLWDIAATPATSTTAGGLTMSDSAPSNPAVGDQWFNTELLETYVWYSDVHGSYWVKSNPTGATERVDVPTDINDLTDTSGVIPADVSDLTDSTSLLGGGGGGSVTTYADMAALIAATGMSTGDQAFVQSNDNLYLYNGTGWYKVATLENLQPTAISGVAGAYSLATDGTPTVITATSSDPEGFPITWSWAVTSGALGTTATVSQADNVFTITPGTNDPADAGTFELTFSVTDGTTGAVSTAASFTLSFSWDIDVTQLSLDANSLDYTGIVNPMGLVFSTDGSKVYVGDINSPGGLGQWTLSTPWDVSTGTGTYDTKFSITEDTQTYGFAFNADGTKLYVSGGANNYVYQYSVSTGWDLSSTVTYDNVSLNLTAYETNASCLVFYPDGSKLFVFGSNDDSVQEFTLSTPYDLSTATYTRESGSLAAQDATYRAIAFNPAGTKMYATGQANDLIHQYTLTTGYDVSTISYDNVSYDISSIETAPRGIFLKNDGTKLYINGVGGVVLQFSTGL
jgi:hypothetical protein